MKYRSNRDSGIVYSSEHGRMCPKCEKPVSTCICRKAAAKPAGDGIVRISRETKGRKGKGVTVITGLPMSTDSLKQLAKQLKKKCGSGGTVKGNIIEIQGDHRDLLVKALSDQGYTVKRSGG